MSSTKGSKINRLLREWPHGTVQVLSYLKEKDYYSPLLQKYKKSHWIESIGTGAYIRAGDKIEWPGAVYALQQQMDKKIHVGGKSALELRGYAHFLTEKMNKLILYGSPRTKLPQWFVKYNWGLEICYFSTNLFLPAFNSNELSEFNCGAFSIKISPPERAIMELLYLVPEHHTFEEALRIMENLATLRPRLVQNLLEKCHSIRVKRLFLYMGEYHNHLWFKDLKVSDIDLGKGKRSIVQNGHLNKKYNITIPRENDQEYNLF